eukprot:NODE_394_length_8135_cov_0.672847.p4 type:complete len:169 gc:universal NODE_394_length_8135_cov_0.672847:5048-5554(+)
MNLNDKKDTVVAITFQMNTTLSVTCENAFMTANNCINKPENALDICNKCGDLTESLFPQCNELDFKNMTLSNIAMKCHVENGQICAKSKEILNIVDCADVCTQFYATMELVSTSEDELKQMDSKLLQNIQKCAENYPNDLQIGRNAGSLSSFATASFSLLTVSASLLL